MTWDADQYLRFAGPRLRPALELLARVELASARSVYDLGCGTGEITAILAQRFAQAQVTGLDNSNEMLEKARLASNAPQWVQANISEWEPSERVDLLYSNAALQWLPDHEVLFPRLLEQVAPGGALAVQMPLSWPQPSHRLMRTILETGGVGGQPLGDEDLRARLARPWVLEPADYYDLLSESATDIDLWTTEYQQVLEGDDPVLEWVRGTGLRPILNSLEGSELSRFLGSYREALRETYPRREDGTTLYPFGRLFLVARR